MFLVQFTNFVYTKAFDSEERAIAHMRRACFESVLMTNTGEVLGHYNPLAGYSAMPQHQTWFHSNPTVDAHAG